MKASKKSVSATGLTLLYQPDEAEPVVDLVFVHGLQGHPRETWECVSGSNAEQMLTSGGPGLAKRGWFSRSRNSSPGVHTGGVSSSQGDSSDKTVFWPLDLLPTDCTDARILTFGYDSQVTKGYAAADKSSIFSHGRDFLIELGRDREVQGRPLILVAHSLGGIVVKEALREAEISDKADQQDILNSLAAVVFFGTPHRGSNMADLGQVAANMASLLLRVDTNNEILRALAIDSPQIEICNRSFVHQWHKYAFQVKTFQEAKALTGVNLGRLNEKVVSDSSSSFGDPREDTEKIAADHSKMCKFTGTEDPGYRKVGPELRRLVRDAARRANAGPNQTPGKISNQPSSQSPASSRTEYVSSHESYERLKNCIEQDRWGYVGQGSGGLFPMNTPPSYANEDASQAEKQDAEVARKEKENLIKEQNECLRSLAFQELGDRERDVEPALVDTCEWLYENDTYKKWQSIGVDEHLARPNMIWIKGKPGAGKSTLMKEAVRRAKKQAASNSTIVIEFFFSSRRNIDLEKTPLGLLRTLLHQLLQKDLMLMAEFLPLWRKKRNTLSEGWQWHRNELQDFLSSVFPKIAREGAKDIFFFIDALDECDERSVRDLVNFFKGLSAAPNLHTCLSSRHFPHISVANCPEIVVEDANRHDIEIYVERKLLRGAYERSELTTEILGKASGVFLWVALVVNLLNKDIDDGKTAEDIADTLRMVPAQLDDLYKNLLGDLTESERERGRAVNLMQWVLLAARPLNLREMQHALAFSLDPRLTSFDGLIGSKSYIDDHDRLARFIRSHSRGLIEVKPPHLSFDSWCWDFYHSPAYRKLGIDDEAFHSGQVDQFGYPFPRKLDRLRDQFLLAQQLGAQSSLVISAYESDSAEFVSRVLAPATCQRLLSHFRSAAASKTPSGFFSENGTWLDEGDIVSEMRFVEYMVELHPEMGRVIDHYLTNVSGCQIVQVIHESVREFFLYGQGFGILDSSTTASDTGERHRSLVSICMRYIGVEDLKDLADGRLARVINRVSLEFASPLFHEIYHPEMGLKTSGRDILMKRTARHAYAFLDYTATFLFYHAIKAENHQVIPEELMDALRNEYDTFWKRWMSLQYRDKFSEDTTPLYALCEMHLFLCAAELLNSGANANKKGGLYSYPIIAALAEARAGVASRDESSNDVEVEIRRKSESMVRLLLKHGADPNVMSKSGESVLYFAVNTGNPAVVSLLITGGAAVNACDGEGRTPLHEAACLQSTEIVAMLLSNDAQVQVCDADGNTPLHLAAKRSSLPVVQQLVQAGSIVHQLNKHGFSALHFAAQSDHSEIVSYLQDELRSDGGTGGQQRTALHTAAESGSLETISIFLAVGADLEACDEDQRTPLHVAARWAEDGAVRLLLDAGSDVNAVDRHLQTPLHLAAKAGGSTLLALVKEGVNINALDEDDRTSLHIAAKDGTAESVRILLEAGADPRLLDRFGRSARSYARAHRSLWLFLDDKTSKLLT
ncbi:hypothetical protein GJ744_010015 [Endocarpon pusillum]|uniref:Nephrocystin 3-like N-terminal domain-containing protein n=1 Tax=Endocarpon pusillum TaxID=364733 RepID=A0A8H7E5T1_9EURO|nr:hypothetical protein GJ744_010015 [Endocarpon pusillum]